MSIYAIKSGDGLSWIAKRNLETAGKQPTQREIRAEMERLARLNDCEDANDLQKRFFDCKDAVGKQIKLAAEKQEPFVFGPAQDKVNPFWSADKYLTPVQVTDVPQTKRLQTAAERNAAVREINNLQKDEDRIVEWHKRNAGDNAENYVVIDKKAARATVYSADGNVVKTFNVGLSRQTGDGNTKTDGTRNEGYVYGKNKTVMGINSHTAAGEFTLTDPNKNRTKTNWKVAHPRHYNNNILDLAGNGHHLNEQGNVRLAIHQIPEYLTEKRKPLIKSDNPEDRRVSDGCINLVKSDYKALAEHVGAGSKLYVLPEEEGNRLDLHLQADGGYKFVNVGHEDPANRVYREETETVAVKADSAKVTISPRGNNIDTTKILTKVQADTGSVRAGLFAGALANEQTKDKLRKELGLTNDEYNTLANVSMGIAGQETRYGKATAGIGIKDGKPRGYWLQETYADLTTRYLGGSTEHYSRGITQIKLSKFTNTDTKSAAVNEANEATKKQLEAYGIKSATDLKDPQKSAMATMIILNREYKEQIGSGRISREERQSGEYVNKIIYAWNKGTKNLGEKSEAERKTVINDDAYVRAVREYMSAFEIKTIRP